MVTDDELDALADAVGCFVTYQGGDVWECCRKSDERTWYGDYAQIYQLLEDLRFARLRLDTRAVALKALNGLP